MSFDGGVQVLAISRAIGLNKAESEGATAFNNNFGMTTTARFCLKKLEMPPEHSHEQPIDNI